MSDTKDSEPRFVFMLFELDLWIKPNLAGGTKWYVYRSAYYNRLWGCLPDTSRCTRKLSRLCGELSRCWRNHVRWRGCKRCHGTFQRVHWGSSEQMMDRMLKCGTANFQRQIGIYIDQLSSTTLICRRLIRIFTIRLALGHVHKEHWQQTSNYSISAILGLSSVISNSNCSLLWLSLLFDIARYLD